MRRLAHPTLAAFAALSVTLMVMPADAADAALGKTTYETVCIACHGPGVAGAPRVGDATAWAGRVRAGLPALYASALKGKNAMPAKGGNTSLTDSAVQAAVRHMVALSQPAGGGATASAPATRGTTPAARVAAPASASATAAATPSTAVAATAPPSAASAAPANANAFNRLLRPPGKRNLPPTEDGIHDPGNDGTLALQAPLAAFEVLPHSNAGNRVDWVKALREQRIAPRADRLDAKAAPMVMDLNIVREVKGSMPDVVYPHKQHTEWLDCSNCHPAIFIPQKGANQISMAAILLGQACGVCHGKVAFPVSECRRCHSRNKAPASSAASAPQGAGK